jgi:DNA repair photolyase
MLWNYIKEEIKLSNKKTITTGTKEWADYNVNCVLGCMNDCRYCYAKLMAKRFGRATEKTWKIMKVRESAITKSYRRFPGRVMFPSSHDIIDLPEIENACFKVLSKLLERGNNVLLTTKPRMRIILKINEVFSRYRDRLQFRFTITSRNDNLLQFWEPNAPLFQERMDCLKFAFSRDFKTSVSIEPFLDHDPQILVKIVAPYSTESIWIGKMNYIPRNNLLESQIPFYNEIRKNCERPHLMKIYEELKTFPKIQFKDSIRLALGLDK